MTSETIDEQIRQLCHATRLLGLVGAALKLKACEDVDDLVRQQIYLGARLATEEDINALGTRRAAQLAMTVEMAFAEAGELLRDPGRGGAWEVQDPDLLQAQGQASRQVFGRILVLAEARSGLRVALSGRFLDVGTGVGGIALEAVERCPGMEVEGIDVWEPALALAHQNVAASQHANRVTISRRDVAELEDGRRYTLVWLPTMFLKRTVLERALDRIAAASVGGAYLVAAAYTRPIDPLLDALAALRTLRSGGEPLTPRELRDMMAARGYVDLEVDETPLATFVLGRLPV